MSGLEGIFLWGGIGACLLAICAYLVGAVFRREAGIAAGWWLGAAGFVLETAAIVARWAATGHSPVVGRYENALAGTWFILLCFLVLGWWYPGIRAMGTVVLPAVLLMLGYGIMSRPEMEPLPPPWQSNWLGVHVIFAWLAYSSFLLVGGLGALYLVKRRAEARGGGGRLLRRLPRGAILDELALRMIMFGLASHTVMIAAGAIWAQGLWGRYWGWDPVETWSLITWLVYGITLHLRLTLGWKGPRAAWLGIAAFAAVLVTFYGLGLVASIHTQLL